MCKVRSRGNNNDNSVSPDKNCRRGSQPTRHNYVDGYDDVAQATSIIMFDDDLKGLFYCKNDQDNNSKPAGG